MLESYLSPYKLAKYTNIYYQVQNVCLEPLLKKLKAKPSNKL